MPDIDIDFSIRGRERVIRYVQEKYGADAVAQIITFGKMKPRAATRDAARVLGFDYATGDRLAKLIPEPIMGRSPSFEDCLAAGTELRKAYDSDPQAKQIVDVARGPRGHRAQQLDPRRRGRDRGPAADRDRAAAARRGPGRPTENGEDGKPERVYKTVTQYSMGPIEEIGLLKMDFLGLRTLDVLENAVAIIERSGRRADRPRRTCRSTTARPTRCSRAATPWACSSSSPRACRRRCAKVRPDASSTTSSRSSRSTARARCASSRTTRAASATRPRCATSTSACARSPSPPTASRSTRSS